MIFANLGLLWWPGLQIELLVAFCSILSLSMALFFYKSVVLGYFSAYLRHVVNKAIVLKPFRVWAYLLNGPKVIQDGFNNSNGKPFEVFAPDNRYVFVSSTEHVEEPDNAPDAVLSLQAAATQMLQPRYTMQGFNWFVLRGTKGTGFVRVIRTLLTNNLPQILPNLGVINRTFFADLHSEHSVVGNNKHSPVIPMITRLVVLSNAVSFFGSDLAKNEQFMTSALSYIEEVSICAEVIRLIPRFLAPLVGAIIGRRLKSQEIVYKTLIPIAEQRVLERDLSRIGHKVPKHANCIQWILETSPKEQPWTVRRLVHELMAVWFGSVHALSTTTAFAIHDLCIHPEYTEPLRKELQTQYTEFESTGLGLPLLDSFIKESARLTPVESMSTRRHVLQPFSLSDGTKLAVGDWACVPARAIMTEAQNYPEPLQFNGFRFTDPALVGDSAATFSFPQTHPSKLTDVNDTWHVWGTGRMTCPGRFYSAALMKVILAQIIMNYDYKLADIDAARWFTWRSSTLPRQKSIVIFTKRIDSSI